LSKCEDQEAFTISDASEYAGVFYCNVVQALREHFRSVLYVKSWLVRYIRHFDSITVRPPPPRFFQLTSRRCINRLHA